MDITEESPVAINLKSLSRKEQGQVKAKRKRYPGRNIYYRNGDFCTIILDTIGSAEYGKLEADLLSNGWSMVIG